MYASNKRPTHRAHRHDDEPRRSPRPLPRRQKTRAAILAAAKSEG
jgi:hypothetical protein